MRFVTLPAVFNGPDNPPQDVQVNAEAVLAVRPSPKREGWSVLVMREGEEPVEYDVPLGVDAVVKALKPPRKRSKKT